MRANMILPWLIVGAVSAAIVGNAAVNMASEAHTAAQQQEATSAAPESDVPELVIIPPLHVVEPYDESNPNAPS